ncbi:MAG: hypothetical protein IPP44_03530 [Ideonella sp.]|jgi:hypothetical protein|nr:hypothetical protein [Ideonella sp.]
MKHRIAVLTWTLPAWVQAHEGHGLGSGSHWHATDALGFVAAALVVAAIVWLMRRK